MEGSTSSRPVRVLATKFQARSAFKEIIVGGGGGGGGGGRGRRGEPRVLRVFSEERAEAEWSEWRSAYEFRMSMCE